MAVKKVGGSVKNGRDSAGRRLGIKKNHMQNVLPGMIICRQRGAKIKLGKNVYYGNDYTIHAKIEGSVYYQQKKVKIKELLGKIKKNRTKTYAHIIPKKL